MTTPRQRIAEIIREAATAYRCSINAVCRGRYGNACAARAHAVFAARAALGISYFDIARFFDLPPPHVHEILTKVGRNIRRSGWHTLSEGEQQEMFLALFPAPLKPKRRRARPRPKKVQSASPSSTRRADIIEFNRASARAARINAVWRERGVEANARAIVVEGRVEIQSDLRLGMS